MATELNVTLKSLPGAVPFFTFDPDENPDLSFPSGSSLDLEKTLLDGSARIVSRVIRRKTDLGLDPLEKADLTTLRQILESRQDVAVCGPWTEDALTYLGLQGGLDDMRVEATRGSVTYTRSCMKANTISGVWHDHDVPVYENHGDTALGKGLHVSDPSQHSDYLHFGRKVYLSANASDNGSTDTTLTFDPDEFDVDDLWTGAYFVVANEEQGDGADDIEVGIVDSIDSANNAIDATPSSGSGVLGNTASLTTAKGAYVWFVNLVADALMDEDGIGAWSENGTPALVEKSLTRKETGTRGLHFIGGSANDGVIQNFGSLPTGTEVLVRVRARAVRGTGRIAINVTGQGDQLSETFTDTTWTWYMYSVTVTGSGAGQQATNLVIVQSGATEAEVDVDRAEVYINEIPNGGFEGTYVGAADDNLAPSWDEINTPATNEETTTVHGGSSAQDINADAVSEGVTTATNVTAASAWYWGGTHVYPSTGAAKVTIQTDGDIPGAVSSGTGAWERIEGAIQAGGAREFRIVSSGGAADFIADDAWLVRLLGNPNDDAVYDLPEPLSSDGFFIFGVLSPDLAANATTPIPITFSRRTYSATASAYIQLSAAGTSVIFYVNGGTAKTASATVSLSNGEALLFAARCTSAGAMKIWAKAGADAIATGAQTGATIATGMSRAWMRYAANYTAAPLGAVGFILIENDDANWDTDAKVEALFDRLTDDEWVEIVQHVDGIQFRPQSPSVTPYPGQPTKYFGSMGLSERKRNPGSVIATQD